MLLPKIPLAFVFKHLISIPKHICNVLAFPVQSGYTKKKNNRRKKKELNHSSNNDKSQCFIEQSCQSSSLIVMSVWYSGSSCSFQ